MQKIELNFLPLEEANFTFEVFRKKVLGATEKKEEIRNYRLYDSSESKERENFEVSLSERDGFTSCELHARHSLHVTNWYLIEKMRSKLENLDSEIDWHYNDRNKTSSIDFTLKKFKEGVQIIQLSPYYLNSKKLFGFVIEFKFRLTELQPFNARVQQLSLSLDDKFRSNKNYYADKYLQFQNFIEDSLPLFSNVDVVFNLSTTLLQINSNLLEKKQFIFASDRRSNSQFMGLKNFGPYEKSDGDIHFIFVFENRFTSFANELFLSLIGKSNPGTFTGMESMFKIRLDKGNVEKIIISNYGIPELSQVIESVKLKSNDKKCFVIFIEDFDPIIGNSEPYYYMKYHLIQNDIPLQVVNYNVLSKSNTLKWSTSNLGLQIFSKLGGKPWVVNPSKKDCLILGIGSSHKKSTLTNQIEKYFAYSVCLDSSGLYKKLEILSESDSEENYLSNLEKNLLLLLNSPEFGDYKSCVLHLPFKIKRAEITSLEKVIKQKGNMEFRVVKINEKNKFFGFSNHNTLVPYESSYISLSNNEFLVWFEGLQFGKENVDKMLSNPVHIQFLNMEGDNFYREDYKPYLQDIINLSGANWRGFNAKSIPISIFYSKLITKYISEFEDFAEERNINISNAKPWFL